MALTSVLNDRTARYFDLINQPDSLKRIDGSSISNPEFQDCPASGTTIPADWDVNTGDVLNWSKGRPTDAYFVLDNRTLLKNPDRTGSGYLTIPLIVTQNTRNALLKYEYVIDAIGKDYVSTVELHPDDIFIQKNWGTVPTSMRTTKVEFIYDPLEEFLYVKVPHASKSKEFKLGSTDIDDIITWFESISQEQASFRLKYDFTGAEFQKFREVYRLHSQTFPLPKTWSAEPGTAQCGADFDRAEWIFYGDRKHLNEAKTQVQHFYKDLTITIDDISE